MTGLGAILPKTRAHLVVLAGPNGAGKSTAAPSLLRGALGVSEFVNADEIARGLSAFDPNSVAITAGKIMLTRMRELAQQRKSFAFETTLASRSFAPWLNALSRSGYRLHLLFLYLPGSSIAVARVAARVKAGGHSVPAQVVRRRYESGLRNFFGLYRPLMDSWAMYNASSPIPLPLIAKGSKSRTTRIEDSENWKKIERKFGKP